MVKKIEEPKTRKVRVNEQRSYVDEEVIEEAVDAELVEDTEINPIQAFLQGIDNSRQLTMKVFLLPNFYKDGKRSIRANERPFVTQFPFSNDDIQDYQQRIQQACPSGGMFQIELREGWQMVKIWEEPISQAPGYQPGNNPPHPSTSYPIIVNPAMNPQPAPVADPMVMIERQAESFLKVAQVIKQLQPEQQPVPVTVNENPERPLQERLVEGLVLKLVENDKLPGDRLDKVLDALGGRPETNWVESLLTAVGPQIGTVLANIAPGINALLFRLAGSPQTTSPSPVVTATSPGIQQQESLPPDPAQRAWFRVLNRILEDLFYHVECVSSGALGVDVHSSAEAVADLGGRFVEHQQLTTTLAGLISPETTPEQVIDLCAMMVPQGSDRILALKEMQTAKDWIKELQEETRDIISEQIEIGSQETTATTPAA